MTVREDLLNAAFAIETAGWNRASLLNQHRGSLCLIGGITVGAGAAQIRSTSSGAFTLYDPTSRQLDAVNLNVAYADPGMKDFNPRVYAAIKEVADHINPNKEDFFSVVWSWNDSVCDGGDAAVALLRETAADL